MSNNEPRAWAPLWLELSGLPELIAQKAKASGWPIFKKIIELDCERNAQPGTVEISLTDLHIRTGVPPETARRTIEALRKLKLIACFLPDNDEEPALFRFHVPLPSPKSFEQVQEQFPVLLPPDIRAPRYLAAEPEQAEDPNQPVNKSLQETVDLYFDTVGLKMNAFILDELRILVDLFSMDDIRRTFRRARKNEIRSLRWVVQELTRRGKPSDKDSAAKASERISEEETELDA